MTIKVQIKAAGLSNIIWIFFKSGNFNQSMKLQKITIFTSKRFDRPSGQSRIRRDYLGHGPVLHAKQKIFFYGTGTLSCHCLPFSWEGTEEQSLVFIFNGKGN
jgi:hypothetical protein